MDKYYLIARDNLDELIDLIEEMDEENFIKIEDKSNEKLIDMSDIANEILNFNNYIKSKYVITNDNSNNVSS